LAVCVSNLEGQLVNQGLDSFGIFGCGPYIGHYSNVYQQRRKDRHNGPSRYRLSVVAIAQRIRVPFHGCIQATKDEMMCKTRHDGATKKFQKENKTLKSRCFGMARQIAERSALKQRDKLEKMMFCSVTSIHTPPRLRLPTLAAWPKRALLARITCAVTLPAAYQSCHCCILRRVHSQHSRNRSHHFVFLCRGECRNE
jgi:hypothetical protein